MTVEHLNDHKFQYPKVIELPLNRESLDHDTFIDEFELVKCAVINLSEYRNAKKNIPPLIA